MLIIVNFHDDDIHCVQREEAKIFLYYLPKKSGDDDEIWFAVS